MFHLTFFLELTDTSCVQQNQDPIFLSRQLRAFTDTSIQLWMKTFNLFSKEQNTRRGSLLYMCA